MFNIYFKNFISILLIFLCFGLDHSFAGAGLIVVKDRGSQNCVEPNSEQVVIRLTAGEAIQTLDNWLKDRPQDLVLTEKHFNVSGRDAKELRSFLNMAFSGYIKFCGEPERSAFYSYLLDALKHSQTNERVFVQLLLHCRAKSLMEMVESRIALLLENTKHKGVAIVAGDEIYRNNLEKAMRLILFQKKSPEPYPTEKAVRRIEKRLKDNETGK